MLFDRRAAAPASADTRTLKRALYGETETALAAGALLPHLREMDDHLDGLLHVLHRHPLEPRVKVVLAGEDVRRRQAHERQPRAVGAAADRAFAHRRGRRARIASRAFSTTAGAGRAPLACSGTALRRSLDARTGTGDDRLFGELTPAASFAFNPAVVEVADDEA